MDFVLCPMLALNMVCKYLLSHTAIELWSVNLLNSILQPEPTPNTIPYIDILSHEELVLFYRRYEISHLNMVSEGDNLIYLPPISEKIESASRRFKFSSHLRVNSKVCKVFLILHIETISSFQILSKETSKNVQYQITLSKYWSKYLK